MVMHFPLFQFVRIADDTPVDKLAELFFGIWKLRKPDLALTLYGSVSQRKSFQKRFDNMIFTVFQKTCEFTVFNARIRWHFEVVH